MGVGDVKDGELLIERTKRSGWVSAAVAGLIAILAMQVVMSVRQESLTWDEGDHIFAGYMSWKTGDFGLNPEHPPLMKLLGTAMLLRLPLKVPKLQGRFFKNEAYFDGRDLLFGNEPAYGPDTLTFRVRMAAGVVTLLLAVLVFFAGQEMFGTAAGLIALTLLAFDPNILAHGAFMTTDTGVSCFYFATVYAFYRYCKAPSVGRMLLTGLACGLALASKHSAVILLPTLVLLAVGEWWMRRRGREVEAAPWWPGLGAALGVGVVLAVVVLWAFYGFRYDARPAGLRLDPTLAQYVLPLRPMEAKGILLVARFHLLPESYLYGLADVRAMANGMPSYIFGKVYEHGVWFYFPAVLLIKSTLGFLALLGLAMAAMVSGRLRRGREVFFLAVPAAIYFLVAMGSSLNIGARHILPVYVFLIVLAAGGSWSWVVGATGQRRMVWGSVIGMLLLFHAVSSAKVYPNYMAYSNEAFGGPTQTYRYLTDSNTDWAQQLKAVKAYVDAHGITHCYFAYFADPFLLPKDYGIPCTPLPTPDTGHMERPVPVTIEGPVLISASDLTWFEGGSNVLNPYREFQMLRPAAYISDGVFVFEGTFQVPLASALSHVVASRTLLKHGKVAEAVAEARRAVGIAPDALQTEMALGDALHAVGDRSGAQQAYMRARMVAQTMEPEARKRWTQEIDKLRYSL